MNFQRNRIYPQLELCQVCELELKRYDINQESFTHRSKTSRKSENENDIVQRKICCRCGSEILDEKEGRKVKYNVNDSENVKDNKGYNFKCNQSLIMRLLIFIGICIIFHQIYINWKPKLTKDILDNELSKLKQKYPNQNHELWSNVLKIANATEPRVHVLILLHKRHGKVAECFAKDLVTLMNKIIEKDGILIYEEKREVVEYGEELNHYLQSVKEHKHLIVLHLNKVSGNKARMFHALCDEAPSAVRPSYFIFTVEDETEGTMAVKRPIARAGDILRSAWSSLMENELHPLISRVVRNVADVLPEDVTC